MRSSAVPLVAAAVLSQFSAAVGDTIGGGGNTAETKKGHIDAKHAGIVICGIAIVAAILLFITLFAVPAG